MRKGYTLIEMLAILGLLVIFFLLMTEPMRTLLSDVPRGHRDFQTAASLEHLLNNLKNDIEAAKELKTANDPNMLIIVGSRKTITYHFADEQVRRMAGADPNSAGLWQLPDIHLVWEVKKQNSLQITGWLERTVLGQKEKKFHNSHIFYAKRFESGEVQ